MVSGASFVSMVSSRYRKVRHHNGRNTRCAPPSGRNRSPYPAKVLPSTSSRLPFAFPFGARVQRLGVAYADDGAGPARDLEFWVARRELVPIEQQTDLLTRVHGPRSRRSREGRRDGDPLGGADAREPLRPLFHQRDVSRHEHVPAVRVTCFARSCRRSDHGRRPRRRVERRLLPAPRVLRPVDRSPGPAAQYPRTWPKKIGIASYAALTVASHFAEVLASASASVSPCSMNPVCQVCCAIGASAPKFQTTAASTFSPCSQPRRQVDRLVRPRREMSACRTPHDAGAVDEQLVPVVRADVHDEPRRLLRQRERAAEVVDAEVERRCVGRSDPA